MTSSSVRCHYFSKNVCSWLRDYIHFSRFITTSVVGKLSNVTINKPVRTRGNIYIYLQKNNNITFNEGSPVIPTDDYLDKPLRTHLIGSGQNNVMIKSSFYGFISLGDPNNMGYKSNSRLIDIQGTNYPGYDKFHGLMLAQNLKIHPPSWSDFVLVDRYDTSGGTGGSTSGYTYAGIMK